MQQFGGWGQDPVTPLRTTRIVEDMWSTECPSSFDMLAFSVQFGSTAVAFVISRWLAGDCIYDFGLPDVSDAGEARPDQVEVMLKDAYVMKGVSHDHVTCVVMTCLDQPPLLLYSDVTGTASNLKKFLQHCCKTSEVCPRLNYFLD